MFAHRALRRAASMLTAMMALLRHYLLYWYTKGQILTQKTLQAQPFMHAAVGKLWAVS
jgi:hypothetical protein